MEWLLHSTLKYIRIWKGIGLCWIAADCTVSNVFVYTMWEGSSCVLTFSNSSLGKTGKLESSFIHRNYICVAHKNIYTQYISDKRFVITIRHDEAWEKHLCLHQFYEDKCAIYEFSYWSAFETYVYLTHYIFSSHDWKSRELMLWLFIPQFVLSTPQKQNLYTDDPTYGV